MKNKKYICIISFILIILIVAFVFVIRERGKVKADFERLENESYDTVFMSMYPIDYYEEEYYTIYRGMEIVKCNYQIPNSKMMQSYMDKINQSDNILTTVYLGIDPEKTDNEEISKIIQDNPGVLFEIAFSHPPINYWTGMSEKKCEETLNKYQTFAECVGNFSNVRLYLFCGEEWLICNPHNYEEENRTNPSVSYRLLCITDDFHGYALSKGNIQTEMENMRQLITNYRNCPVDYPNGSEYDIVFLGDSIFGDSTDSMSIPQVVSGLTGANVYNCSVSGKSATTVSTEPLSSMLILDSLINEEISVLPQEHHVYTNAYEFVNRENDKKLMFVINFGLNDYFAGYPMDGVDEYDEHSFSGALRTMVKKIQTAYPDATIILCTPNFTVEYDYGKSIQSEKGGTLEDYANTIIGVAKEMGVKVLDNYNELPITETNYNKYLKDGTHFNERGRFLMGNRIAMQIP